MLLKSVKLNNIRSYTNASLEFPKGSVLLAGDIGAGKSSILLAIEFALFGAKTELPASSLLRHGKNEGSAELNFELEGKDIVIKRTLKRGKNGISQGSGYVIVNDIKKEGMHEELKADVIGLLGYPKELASKGKDLVYRYTVYTPQEEMKKILLEGKETRLETLRKVFNIDKYKRVRENASIFVRSIKEKRRELEGFISDLELKKKEKEGLLNEILDLERKLVENKPRLEKIKIAVAQNRESIRNIEGKISRLNRIKMELEVLDVELKNRLASREKNSKEAERIEKEIREMEEELKGKEKIDVEKLRAEIRDNEKQIDSMGRSIRETINKASELNLEIKKSRELKDKVISLSKCPLCEQDVSKEHKHFINERERAKLEEFEEKIKDYAGREIEEETKLRKMRENLMLLRRKESSLELINLKIRNLGQKTNNRNNLLNEQEAIKKDIGRINVRKIELNRELQELIGAEKEYGQIKEKFELNINQERKLELENNSLEKEKEGISKIIASLEKDIGKKTEAKDKCSYLGQMQNWIEEFFTNLMGSMERHVMLQVYREFNELLKSWFNILIEDETISVRLDDEFTPVIEQNGYETSFENLSGGERTSVALSYRLALNKVINDIVSGIKTKDIIILDEPTDGFSSEQLDKVRDVLEQLNMKQVIIVSHESKIESFVDNVIRVGKQENISSII
ncbi:SMC family ATPase [Candidatus Woesearchaeota archaeon]|nr:SMC family ATPase [Candidatus Woesearchaeota archaeon]